MKPIERQLALERVKADVSAFHTLNIFFFRLKTKELVWTWAAVASVVLIWLLSVTQLLPPPSTWLGFVPLILFAYSLFRQSEKYRFPYCERLNIIKERWVVRKELADLERVRDSLKREGVYAEPYIKAYTEQLTAFLELKHTAGIQQHPLYLFILGLLASPIVQLLTGNDGQPSAAVFVVLLFTLLLTVTVVPVTYDILTGERRLLGYLLQCSVTISGDFATSTSQYTSQVRN